MAQLATKHQLRQESMAAKALGYPTGDVLFVDADNGNDGNSGVTKEHALQTLVQALTKASAGDTIVLAPGGSESLSASVAVSLAGLKIICPVTNPQQGYELTGAGTLDLLTVSAADVHLEGLRFTRTAGAGSTTAGILTTAAADRLTVRRCAFDYTALSSSWTNYGIELTDDIDDVLIEECLFLDCHRGVLFATATAKTLDRCTIRRCTFHVGQATAWGVYSEPAGTGLVQGLQILDNVFVEADGDGSAATDPWDGTDGTDGASGPIWLDADVDQSSIIAGNRAYTASAGSFVAVCAIDAGALVSFHGNQPEQGTLSGEADIDISVSDYTGFIELLNLVPTAGRPCRDVVIDLDWNKTTTGFDTVATAADTLDSCVTSQADGTNGRNIANGTQVTANGDGTLEASEDGQRFSVGDVHPGVTISVQVKLSTERGDTEIPYRVSYRGAPPVITAVAAA